MWFLRELNREIVPSQNRLAAPHKALTYLDLNLVAARGACGDLTHELLQLRAAGLAGTVMDEPVAQHVGLACRAQRLQAFDLRRLTGFVTHQQPIGGGQVSQQTLRLRGMCRAARQRLGVMRKHLAQGRHQAGPDAVAQKGFVRIARVFYKGLIAHGQPLANVSTGHGQQGPVKVHAVAKPVRMAMVALLQQPRTVIKWSSIS